MTFLARHLFGLSTALIGLVIFTSVIAQMDVTGRVEPGSLLAFAGVGLILAFARVGRAHRGPIHSGDLRTVSEIYHWSLRHGDADVLRQMSENILELQPESAEWAVEAAIEACNAAGDLPGFTLSVTEPRSLGDDLRMARLWLVGRSHIRRAAAGMYLSGLAQLSRDVLSPRQFEILTVPVYSAFDRVGGLGVEDPGSHDHAHHEDQ